MAIDQCVQVYFLHRVHGAHLYDMRISRRNIAQGRYAIQRNLVHFLDANACIDYGLLLGFRVENATEHRLIIIIEINNEINEYNFK